MGGMCNLTRMRVHLGVPALPARHVCIQTGGLFSMGDTSGAESRVDLKQNSVCKHTHYNAVSIIV